MLAFPSTNNNICMMQCAQHIKYCTIPDVRVRTTYIVHGTFNISMLANYFAIAVDMYGSCSCRCIHNICTQQKYHDHNIRMYKSIATQICYNIHNMHIAHFCCCTSTILCGICYSSRDNILWSTHVPSIVDICMY